MQAAAQYNGCLLDQAHRDRIEVVLVSPRNPLNIGAVARAMANFGFTRLTVVAPFEAHWREARSAVGAPTVLADAQETKTLAEALADCTLAVGTGTLTARRAEQQVVSLPDMAPLIARELERDGRVAIIFGPEKHGLTQNDLAHCHLLMEIPTDARQPSMNLGQAAAVCLYEIATRRGSADGDGERLPTGEAAATGSTLEMLAEVIGETMDEARYSPAPMREANQHDVRLLLRRIGLTSGDARRALGFFRRILWHLRHRP